ncbi:hypothetical protein [Natranaerofaba carboxydovora]|uniref:hypothetical protein n=1 Tax=Natranaerofaba carboxydovora TaxID=2742683 RepID=UPI001F144F51|nr:hypothetical protein [Natranaerofaba carboxydovora]UMZ73006.1 hypothetical protein ACONDI_00550 [Natranaerofaba carboxydovora]
MRIVVIDKRENKFNKEFIEIKESDYLNSGISEYVESREAVEEVLKKSEKIIKIVFYSVFLLTLIFLPFVVVAGGILTGFLYVLIALAKFVFVALLVVIIFIVIFYFQFGRNLLCIEESVKGFLNSYAPGYEIKNTEWVEVKLDRRQNVKLVIND